MLRDCTSGQVIACLDVRTNDEGDLVVTKGDQYDVRENTKENEVSQSVKISKHVMCLNGFNFNLIILFSVLHI